MRDDELRHLLASSNPWWNPTTSSTWTNTHRLLANRHQYDIGYRTHILDDIATQPLDDTLVVLNGPRRIGKSVAMIDTIAALCARDDIDTRQIIHVPCDGMSGHDLRRSITLGRALTTSIDVQTPRQRVWFFDEISDISGWTTTLKQARDQTNFGDDTVIATGSRWAGTEDIYGNLMAGRAGTSNRRRIRHLAPMSFRDFLTATNPDLPCPPTVHPADLQSDTTRSFLTDSWFLVDTYDLAWQDYLTCGGFPRASAEYVKTGVVSQSFSTDLLGWLRTDVDPEAAQQSVPLLLSELAARATSPLNLRHLSESLNYGSRGILERRLKRLVTSQAVLVCPQVDDQARRVPGAQNKVYLVDPVLAWTPSRVSPGLVRPDFTQLSETVLGVGLARCLDDITEGRWVDGDTIGYSRCGSGGEVDFAPVHVGLSSGVGWTTPIESKWVDTSWRSQARSITARYGRGIVATKSVLDVTGPVWAAPAPLVALLLN